MNNSSFPNASNIQRHVLDNGLIVLLYHNPNARTAVIEGGLWAGAQAETRQTAGLASFVASMLMRGTQQRSFQQIYHALESVGASLSFGNGYQMTDFSAEALVEDLDLLLDLIAEALQAPTFAADQIEKVRAEKMTRLYMRQNDTGSVAHLKFNEALYGDHPFGRSVNGYLETVPAITREQLVAFHRRYYGPTRAIITIVGGIEPADALAKVQQALGDWRKPQAESLDSLPDAARPTAERRIFSEMPAKTQSDIVFGLPGPRRSEPDYMAAKVANTILGIFGMMGRLGRNVREKQGLAYYVRSILRPSLGPAAWSVSTGVAPENVEQALQSSREEVRRIQQEPVSDEELADTKAYLTGSLPLSIENNSGLADIIFNMELYDLGLDYLDHFADQVNGVTVADVQAAAQKYFSADNVVISVAGPKVAD